MGNVCQNCEQSTGQTEYNPGKRSYTSQVATLTTTPAHNTTEEHRPNELGLGDAPNPNNVSPTTLPPLSRAVKEILNKETLKKPFHTEMVSGTKFPSFQLLGQKKKYDGEWKNGVPHGKGKAYFDSGMYFQGYFKNGVADCDDGIFIYPDGIFYRGQVRNSKSNGQGTLVYRDNELEYTGEWLNDKPHGMGKEIFKDGSYYIGNFVNGQKSGSGTFRWPDGSEYKGQFIDGNMHGNGQHRMADGVVYKGAFVKNIKQGHGTWKSDAGVYVGQFFNDQKQGEGEFTFSDGRWFRGAFKDGVPDGAGIMKLLDGQVINGVWKNGEIFSFDGSSTVVSERGSMPISRQDSLHSAAFQNNHYR